MVEPNIFIGESKEEEKCSLCDTFIKKGERCLIIFSTKGEKMGDKWHNIKVHLSCVNSFLEEIRLILKNALLENLEDGDKKKK